MKKTQKKNQQKRQLTRSNWWAWELSAGWLVWDWRLIFGVLVILQILPAQAVIWGLIKDKLETFTWSSALISRILGSDPVIVASVINSIIGVSDKVLSNTKYKILINVHTIVATLFAHLQSERGWVEDAKWLESGSEERGSDAAGQYWPGLWQSWGWPSSNFTAGGYWRL